MRLTLIRKLSALLLVLCVGMACNLARMAKKGVDGMSQPVVLKSSNGKSELTIPGGWREDSALNDQAVLKASNRLEELYAIVITDTKEDMSDGMTLDKYAVLMRDNMSKNVTSPETTEPVPTTVNNYPARQCELHGAIKDIKASYIITAVETPGNFHQIITWTLRSRFDQNQAVLRSVTQTFRETSAQTSDTNAPPAPAR